MENENKNSSVNSLPDAATEGAATAKAPGGKKPADRRLALVALATGLTLLCAGGAVTGVTLLKYGAAKTAAGNAAAGNTATGNTASHQSSPTATSFSAVKDRPADLGGILHQAASMDDIMANISPAIESSMTADYSLEDVSLASAETAGVSAADAGAQKDSYSTTNLQVEGIDEGDIIKTDGSFFYQICDEYRVKIVSVDQGSLTELSTIEPSSIINGGYYLSDLYLDSDRHLLYVLGQRYYANDDCFYSSEEGDGMGIEDAASGGDSALVSRYSACPCGTGSVTYLFAYDISDPANPALKDCFTQDGFVTDSRMVDGTLYLFTTYSEFTYYVCDKQGETHAFDYQSDDPEDALLTLPYVDGCQLSYSDIYLPEDEVYSQTVLSAIDLAEDGSMTAEDSLSVMTPYAQCYMSADALYLYFEFWDDDHSEDRTRLVKFSYADETITPTAATEVDGYLPDTFAISEQNGYLYLLLQSIDYSSDDYDSKNSLIALDASLNICSQITDIAPGEYIYAARYIDNMAYFITYESVDPLFVADLSDPYHLTLLGSVEISGYSDYLHPFGENRLLGIGYETVVTETGSLTSDTVKLVMFDTTDPLHPVVLDSLEIPNSYYSEAIYNYKTLLVNPETGLIGLPVNTCTDESMSDDCCCFDCFYWDGSAFRSVASINTNGLLEDGFYWNCRGSYIGDWLYVSSDEGLASFDMKKGFAQGSVLKY